MELLLRVLVITSLLLARTTSENGKLQRVDEQNFVQFAVMVTCATSLPGFLFNDYGCHCGLGGKGTPVDDVDRCECVCVPWGSLGADVRGFESMLETGLCLGYGLHHYCHYEHDGQRKRTKYTVPEVDKGTSLHCYYVKRCCQIHDECYDSIIAGVCRNDIVYLTTYKYTCKYRWPWSSASSSITCDSSKNDACRQSLCECDRNAALCFARSKYNIGNTFYDKNGKC